MIKPCPFCGDPESPEVISFEEVAEMYDKYEEHASYSSSGYFVICDAVKSGCGAMSGFGKTKKDAIALWNQRAPSTGLSKIY